MVDINPDAIFLEFRIPSLDYDHRWWRFDYSIICHGESDGDETTIGKGHGYIISNPGDYDEFVDISDEINTDCYDLCSNISPDLYEEFLCYNIVIIGSMVIDQDYRGKGAGLVAMNIFTNYFAPQPILIYPHPYGEAEPEEVSPISIKKLQDYWTKCGFQRDGDKPVFYYH